MALGSMTGIFVVSVIGWLMFTQFSWDIGKYFSLGQPSVSEENSIISYFKNMGTFTSQGLDFILDKLYRLITLPVSILENFDNVIVFYYFFC